MDRRTFIRTAASSLFAASLTSRAQQPSKPILGYLSTAALPNTSKAVRQGLSEMGYVDGENLIIEARSAEGHYDRLPALATELVRRQVAVIVAVGGNAAALAAKRATNEIPIVFLSGGDPVLAGLVASLSRPGGNISGVTTVFSALVPKRLELLQQLVPKAASIGALVNPNYSEADLQERELQEAARATGQQMHVVRAATHRDIEAAFSTFAHLRTDALLIANDPFFESLRYELAKLAAHYGVPAIYSGRDYVEAGGLMSYGPNLADAARQAGIYAGRVLKGAKAADLPVLQPTKFELFINLKSAKALGLSVPQSLLLRADEILQ